MAKALKFPQIEIARLESGYTRSTVSEKLNIDRRTYSNWLSGGNIPSSKLVELSKILNRSIDYLLGLVSDKAS